MDQKDPDIHSGFGAQVDGMRDASGQMYMRNRYYDPATGQFTQPDPIGLAGGLNSYGFAAGDPVSYSDPCGLCPIGGWRSRFRRTTSTEDCPKSDIGRSLRLIEQHGGDHGGAVLQQVVNARLDIGSRSTGAFRRQCGGVADGACVIDNKKIIVNAAQSDVDMAIAIVHEVGHTQLSESYPTEELIVREQSMMFMSSLPEEMRNSSRHLREYRLWNSDRAKWRQTVCNSIQAAGNGQC